MSSPRLTFPTGRVRPVSLEPSPAASAQLRVEGHPRVRRLVMLEVERVSTLAGRDRTGVRTDDLLVNGLGVRKRGFRSSFQQFLFVRHVVQRLGEEGQKEDGERGGEGRWLRGEDLHATVTRRALASTAYASCAPITLTSSSSTSSSYICPSRTRQYARRRRAAHPEPCASAKSLCPLPTASCAPTRECAEGAARGRPGGPYVYAHR